jgi:DNA-binding transcriptional LysR family regulator
VVRCGSITRAASTLGFNQSTVSRRLQRLEQEVGEALLDRSVAPLVPTEAGRHFVRFATEVIERRNALDHLLRGPAPLVGELRVGASSAPAAGLAPQFISAFLSEHPRVRTQLKVMDTRSVEEAVAAQRVAVGFTGSRPRDGCLTAVPVGRDEIRLVLPRGADFDGLPDPLPPERLEAIRFVEREEGSATLETVREALHRVGSPERWQVALQVDSADAALAAVAAGVGATFASGALLARYQEWPIRSVTVAGVSLSRPLFMVADPVVLARDPVAARFHQFVTRHPEARRAQGAGG